MASAAPTRRSTRTSRQAGAGLGDENANPPITRSRVTKPIGGNATAATSASLAKRATSKPVGSSKDSAAVVGKGKSKVEVDTVGARRRAALGEVAPNKSSNTGTGAAGSKAAREVKELKTETATRPTIGRRPTRASIAAANAGVDQPAVTRPTARKRITTAQDKASVASVSTSTTSRARATVKRGPVTAQPTRQAVKRAHTPPEVDDVAHDDDQENDDLYEPVTKKIRTSDAVVPELDENNVVTAVPPAVPRCYKIPIADADFAIKPREPTSALGGPDTVVDWDDLDAEDVNDPQMVTEYVHDILKYMRELEIKTMPNPDYMDGQPNIQWKMRGILMDWLVEIHHKFRLLPETLFLAANLVDRFLSARVVSLEKLQLVGLTCLFIAAKYEEVVCPAVANFLYMTDGGYTDEEILNAERYVLTSLDFDLSYPNPIHFLRRISKADGYDIQTRTVAKCLMEISCVDERFIATPPSLLSAAAVWFARLVLERDEWNANLAHYSGYTEQELLPTAQLMADYVHLPHESAPHEMFEKKWSGKKYMKAITYLRDWTNERWGPGPWESPDGDKTLDAEMMMRGPLQMDLEKQARICGRGLCRCNRKNRK